MNNYINWYNKGSQQKRIKHPPKQMKKPQTILIAVILIIVHLAVLIFMAGNGDSSEPSEKTPIPEQTKPKYTDPAYGPKFEIPKLNVPEIAPQQPSRPPATTTSTPAPKVSNIARPGSKEGYLRNDLPNRKTSKVFASLKKDPYVAAIVVDARTGKILLEDQATNYGYPASVTKMMTLLLVLEKADQKKLRISDMVQIPKEASSVGGSQAYLDPREAFSVDDLLNALMIHSANDAAAALAIHVAGSVAAFVEQMNQKAKELGMNATVYNSPHGLPPGGGKQPDISTAHDIALLSMELLRYKETLGYTGTELTYLPLTNIRKEEFMLANRNKLVKRVGGYEGCDGLKTGYHNDGGWSISATSEKNGKRIIAVALGCENRDKRTETIKNLLDKGFERLQ